LTDIGKIMVITGLLAVMIGLLLIFSEKSGSWNLLNWFGHLPLDFKVERENVRLYFPMGSSIVLSLLLSILLYLFNKFIR